MMRAAPALLLLSLWLATPCSAIAAEGDRMAMQHADIAAQRQAVQRRFEEKQRDCQQRFIVTACIEAAQKERRETLAPLRQEELRLDTLERKQRAAARLEAIEAKQRADTAKEGSVLPRSSAASKPEPGAPAPAARPIIVSKRAAPLSDDERKRREAASLARFEASQTAAGQRREAADARNAKRAASGKVTRPLPLPGAASAP